MHQRQRPEAEVQRLVLRRISTTALGVGIRVGKPGCKPNLIVVATDNAEALLKDSARKNKRAFLGDAWTIRVGQDKLGDFIASDMPVRWWFVVKRVTRDGAPYEEHSEERPTFIEGAGRTRSAVRADFSHVFIILDVSRIRTVRFSALADYVAMVSLAQTSPDAEFPDAPTILRLFSDRDVGLTAGEGLTAWDRAFLKGLYAAKRDARRIGIQELEIRRIHGGRAGHT